MYVHNAKQQLCVHYTSVKQLQIPRYNYKQFLENTYFPSVHSFCKLMRSTKSHIGHLHNAEYMYVFNAREMHISRLDGRAYKFVGLTHALHLVPTYIVSNP